MAGDDDVGMSVLGIRFAADAILGGVNQVPRASFGWQHAFGDVDPTRSSWRSLAVELARTISGAWLAPDSALIEAGLDIILSPEATLGITYNGEIRDRYEDHGVSGRRELAVLNPSWTRLLKRPARFRPILMTSFTFRAPAFCRSCSRKEQGLGSQIHQDTVFTGMLASTCLAVLFVPSLFVVVKNSRNGGLRKKRDDVEAYGAG